MYNQGTQSIKTQFSPGFSRRGFSTFFQVRFFAASWFVQVPPWSSVSPWCRFPKFLQFPSSAGFCRFMFFFRFLQVPPGFFRFFSWCRFFRFFQVPSRLQVSPDFSFFRLLTFLQVFLVCPVSPNVSWFPGFSRLLQVSPNPIAPFRSVASGEMAWDPLGDMKDRDGRPG